MSPFKDLPSKIPLLSLPNMVLIPGSEVPIALFEEGHVRMVRDVLGTHRLIVIALEKRNNDPGSAPGRRSVNTIACLSKILTHESLPDGRFNVTFMGLRKAIMGPEHAIFPYRLVEVRVLAKEKLSDDETLTFKSLRTELERLVIQSWWQGILTYLPEAGIERLSRVHDNNFIMLLCFMLKYNGSEMQEILEAEDPLQRLMLIRSTFEDRLLQAAVHHDTGPQNTEEWEFCH